MKSKLYPFGEFSNCAPDCETDQFTSRVFRYSRALEFLVRDSFLVPVVDTNDSAAAEHDRLAWFLDQSAALTRATKLRCSTVDGILNKTGKGWSFGAAPLLLGVAVQFQNIADPDYTRSQGLLHKNCDVIEMLVESPFLSTAVYDARDSEQLSSATLTNGPLLTILGVSIVRFDLQWLRLVTSAIPIATCQTSKRISLVTKQRQQSIESARNMLSEANFGEYSLGSMRRMLIDFAMASHDELEAREVLNMGLNGTRGELIAFSTRIAGSLR